MNIKRGKLSAKRLDSRLLVIGKRQGLNRVISGSTSPEVFGGFPILSLLIIEDGEHVLQVPAF